MKLYVCSVLDKAVGAFGSPFFTRSKGEAVRSFMEAAADEKSNFHRHADDYVLFHLGLYDDNTGLFECSEPSRIISASECLNAVEMRLSEQKTVYDNGPRQ